MADVIKMTDGTTSVDLYYDVDGFEMLAGGNDFGTSRHKNLYHESAALDGAMLVRHSKENRSWSFKLAIRGANNTAIATTLGTFNRLVDQARRYQLSSSGQKVYLEIQLDGASQATYYDVVDVDYSKAAFFNYYNLRQKELIFGDGLSLTVITKPIGYGNEETLENFIKNPHFEEDSNLDGLCDNWNKSGTPTTSTSTFAYLVGSGSQKIVTDAAGTDGIYTDPIACTAYQGLGFVGYVWVNREYGYLDDITLDIVGNVSGSLDTATYNTATITTPGKTSRIFSKLVVSGTIGASDTEITIRVERLAGDASIETAYYVDKCYFQMGTSVEPIAWASSKTINNYLDDEAVPYIDVTGVAGDVNPVVQITFTPSGDSKASFIHIANAQRSKYASTGYFWWIDGNTNADAGRTQDKSDRITADTSWRPVLQSGYGVSSTFKGEFIAMVAMKSSAAITGKIRYCAGTAFSGSGVFKCSDEIPVSLTTGWNLFASAPLYLDSSSVEICGIVQLQLKLDSGAVNVDTDFVMSVPVDEYYTIISTVGTSDYIHLKYDGTATQFDLYDIYYYITSPTTCLGGAVSFTPSIEQRMAFMFYGTSLSNKTHALDYATVVIKYRPQTEFLLP